MKERLLNVWNTIKEKTSALSSKMKKLIIGGIVFCILISVGIAVWLNNKPYEVLFEKMNSEEASEVIGKLQEEGIEYKYQNDGTILVPADQEEALKAQLVYEGYPDSGFTYRMYLDNVSLTSTESEKEHYELLDLQEKMGATISLFPNVKDAKVTIALGEDKRYVLDDKNKTEASASVTVLTDDGEAIDNEGVKAIQRLVSNSIPGVQFSNVAVICNGQDVTVEEESESQSAANKLKLAFEKEVEDRVRKKISDVLLPIYGNGHYQISVKSEVDIDKKLREITNYSAEDPEKNTGVISSESSGWEIDRDNTGEGGVPGTETNADIPVYTQITTDGSENYVGADGDINYLVDQLKEQTEIRAGDITDLTVAVIIDGNDLGGVERDNLVSLIAKAAGIDPAVEDDKIEIVNVPFYSDKPEEEPDDSSSNRLPLTKQQIVIIAAIAGIALLLIIILIVVLLLRRRKRALEREREEEYGYAAPLASAIESANESDDNLSDDLLNLKNERGMELKNKISTFTEENPEISAQLLKQWLKGGDNNG